MNGFIKLFRQFKEWEWYSNNNVKSLFIHCLLSANFKDKKWQGTIIKRGQFVTSLSNLADELGLTAQNIRTALEKLTKTGELTKQSTSIYTVITVCKYDSYQVLEDEDNTDTNTVVTNDQQTSNKRVTNDQQQLKKDKKDKNVKKDKNNIYISPYLEVANFFKDYTGKQIVIKNTDSQIMNQGKFKILIPRLKEGATVEQCKDIIKLKYKQWGSDNYMKQYLTFDTLFGKKNFEKYLDELQGSVNGSSKNSYTPPYSIPTFESDNERWMFFMARYEAYKPYLAEYKINTEYRQRAIFKKDAEGLCYELEQQNPNLAQIQVQTA